MVYYYFFSWQLKYLEDTGSRILNKIEIVNGEFAISGGPITLIEELRKIEEMIIDNLRTAYPWLKSVKVIITNFQLLRTEPEPESNSPKPSNP